ncbi:hypothetical protein EWM64_g8946 [Hericium alpestre]|uniref:Uncharacterized protein n=1 Tax=Hericium alpestre TaxID=135208 RepID=A0A4Y9ZJT0_9AGAM|nr:hypothetical protein EWM64_g8946 [Hericium alpestre]
MSLTSTKILPNPISVKGKPAFWLVRGELRVLRPQWELTWEANAVAWVDEVAAKIKSHGHLWDLRTTAAVLKEYTLESIAQAIHTAFENYQQQYQLSRKPIAIQAARRSATRRNGRKKAKANLRASYRWTVPAMAGPEYDHAFTPGYQSTDDSVQGDVSALDPATEDEGATVIEEGVKVLQHVKASTGPFETHAPTYRLDETTPLLDEVDSNIAKKRGAANRYRGAPRDKPLPLVRKSKGKLMRIPRNMVNPVWLAEHKESDKPRFMAADGIVANDEEDQEEGEDGEGVGRGAGMGAGEEGQEDEGIEDMYLDPRLQDE